MPHGNEITEPGTPEKADLEQTSQRCLDIDPAIIEIALAVSAVAALVATQGTNIVVRAFAAIAFILSGVSAAELYWIYLASRIPETLSGFYERRGVLKGYSWLARQWVKLLTSALVGDTPDEEYETLGLLNLLAAFVLLMFVIAAWVAISFFP